MRGTVRKWGNSAAIRMPIAVMEEARLSIDQVVDLRVEKGRIIIEPVPAIDLDALLAGVTDDNLHDEVNAGPPVGREAL
jgi:antitoxin MazE